MTTQAPQNLAHLLCQAARQHPEREAVSAPLEQPAVRWTYAELARHVAQRVRSWGELPSQARIAVLDHNSSDYIELYFAAAAGGWILAPLNTRLVARELAEILEDCGPSLLVTRRCFEAQVQALIDLDVLSESQVLWLDGQSRQAVNVETSSSSVETHTKLDACVRPVSADTIAQLYYTSGTTGRPKGVQLSHGNVWSHAQAVVHELQLSEHDVWGHFAPLFHLADAWASFAMTAVGARHVCLPSFEAPAARELIHRESISLTNLVPTMMSRLLALTDSEPEQFASLRMALTGGAPIAPATVAKAMQTLNCEYVQTYGLTETCPYLTFSLLNAEERELPEEEQMQLRCKTGRALQVVELRLANDGGSELPQDGQTIGEIQARGPTVTSGYWSQPEATKSAFVDGWFRTGDLATCDARGFYNIVDRKKDMLITGGENVYTIEVENALYHVPEVLEAAVFGLPSAKWGEEVVAAVALRPNASETSLDDDNHWSEKLRQHCRELLAAYKVPKRIWVLPASPGLPKTGSGKIKKRELRERFGD